MHRRTASLTLLATAADLLTACSKPDPQKALEAAARELLDSPRGRSVRCVRLLHP